MSRSLATFGEKEKMLAISRRLKQGLVDEANRGCGFWAAFAAIRHYPAASLTLEVRGTYLDIEKQLNQKRSGKHEGKKHAKQTFKRSRDSNPLRRSKVGSGADRQLIYTV